MAKLERVSLKVAGFVASAALALACPLAATADQVPSYATGSGSETIHGTIATVTGKYTLTLSDDRGFSDSVTMHDGTVIQPTGLSLETGQEVTITGHTDGKTFDADEIDTDGSQSTDYGPNNGYYSSYGADVYPPYVIPIGNGGYYYGNGYGGNFGAYGAPYGGGYYYYPNQGSSSGSSSNSSGQGKTTPVGGGNYAPQPHPPVVHPRPPATPRFYAPPASQRSSSSGSRGSSSGRSSGSSNRR